MSRLPKIGDLVRFRYDEVDLSRHATGLVINDGRDPTAKTSNTRNRWNRYHYRKYIPLQ